jgi:pre-mRNA-splicing helicase BRR2
MHSLRRRERPARLALGRAALTRPSPPGPPTRPRLLQVGEEGSNQLLAIKRVTLGQAAKAKLDFAAPAELGSRQLKLTFMCDSYLGADQEYEFELKVVEGEAGSSSGDEEMEDAEKAA